MIQRYAIEGIENEYELGDHVRYTDHLAEIARLTEELRVSRTRHMTNFSKANDCNLQLQAELQTERDEVLRLQHWVQDLQKGMYINCVYCGHRYGPNSEVPASMADVLKEHIEQCPKHPMSALKIELATWKKSWELYEAELQECQKRLAEETTKISSVRVLEEFEEIKKDRDKWRHCTAKAKAELQECRKVLKDAGESVCSLQCPSTWKTGSEPPHSELCKRIREILK